jgi:hypothetical protein
METKPVPMHEPGAKSTGIQRWETKGPAIPLAISIIHWGHPNPVKAITPLEQPIIQASIDRAALDGWRADEPIDFATLFSRSQVRTRNTFLRWRVDSMTIQMTRPIWDEHLIPHG